MGKKFRKSLRIYFSKLKKIRTMSLPNPPTTSSLLSACKHPKTSSFAVASRGTGDGAHAATLSDVDRFLFENFQSLYIRDDDHDIDSDDDVESSPSPSPSPDAVNPSNMRTSTASSSAAIDTDFAVEEKVLPGKSVAVVTFSKDPYDDFRRSMQDMVDARGRVHPGQPLDWDFVGELLFCYLDLNDRTVHKHILRAFADVAVGFQRRPTATTTRRRRKKKKPVMEE